MHRENLYNWKNLIASGKNRKTPNYNWNILVISEKIGKFPPIIKKSKQIVKKQKKFKFGIEKYWKNPVYNGII